MPAVRTVSLRSGEVIPALGRGTCGYRYGRVVTVDGPWGFGDSLEWATSCPRPRHNFTELPRVRSERPAFELHYPQHVGRTAPSERGAKRAGREEMPDDDPRSR